MCCLDGELDTRRAGGHADSVPGWLQHFLGVAGPLSLMKMRDRHIERDLVTAKSTGVVPDLFSMLDIKRAMQALKANDPMPKNLCCLIAGGIMSFEVTPTEELLASLESLKRLVAALRACGADVTTVADWLRIDEAELSNPSETARLILYMSKEEVAQRPESSKGPPQACVAQLRSAGPWPGAAVLGSRVHAREGQLEAQAMSTALLGLFPGSLVPDAGPTAELLEDLVAARGRPTEHRVRAIAALARPQLSEPRRWAWDLQVAVLEAIEDRMEAEAFQFASDHDPSLRSEYEAVCALSTALLLPHLAAALDLVFSQAFPPWQCLWALRHAVAASTRLVALLQAYLETKTRQSLKSALSVLVPEGSRRPSGDLSWSFQKVQETPMLPTLPSLQ
ncbi:unnamed protein product [Effrenium voratum]|nr:unnamed protein product [Effrenium voratum]